MNMHVRPGPWLASAKIVHPQQCRRAPTVHRSNCEACAEHLHSFVDPPFEQGEQIPRQGTSHGTAPQRFHLQSRRLQALSDRHGIVHFPRPDQRRMEFPGILHVLERLLNRRQPPRVRATPFRKEANIPKKSSRSLRNRSGSERPAHEESQLPNAFHRVGQDEAAHGCGNPTRRCSSDQPSMIVGAAMHP